MSWWVEFTPKFNGTSLIFEPDWSQPDEVLSTDSCLSGGKGFAQGRFFHWEFPREITELNLNINQLECLTLVVAVKLWQKYFPRKRILLQCDNMTMVSVVNSGGGGEG